MFISRTALKTTKLCLSREATFSLHEEGNYCSLFCLFLFCWMFLFDCSDADDDDDDDDGGFGGGVDQEFFGKTRNLNVLL